MEQVEQNGTALDGNTERSSNATYDGKKYRNWCFTLNNYTMEQILSISNCKTIKNYIFQEETGELGTKHLQGYIEFNSPRTMSGIKKDLGINELHLEVSRNKKASVEYCRKNETRTGQIYMRGFRQPLKSITKLYRWQQNIVDMVSIEPKDFDRTIHWYYDEKGAIGKTELAKYITDKYCALYLTGKCADCKYAITQWLDANEDKELRVVMYGITRSQEAFVSYQALEEIKDGIFFNTKYEAKMVRYNTPHVIVFANFAPELNKLSLDRWHVVNLGDDINVIPNEDTNSCQSPNLNVRSSVS